MYRSNYRHYEQAQEKSRLFLSDFQTMEPDIVSALNFEFLVLV